MIPLLLNTTQRTESLLSLSYIQLMEAVGDYLGFGTSMADYNDSEKKRCNVIVQAGLRQFYRPIRAASGRVHEWGFLKPVQTLSLVAGTYTYDLPANFGSIEGRLTYDPGEYGCSVVLTSAQKVMEMRQWSDAVTGPPKYAAIVPKTSNERQRRYEILMYPTPDQAYTLSFRMNILQGPISENNPYVYGGELHAETITEACLSVAEQRLNDQAGMHTQLYRELLDASIVRDASANEPESLGVMRDDSDINHYSMIQVPLRRVTVGGVTPI